MGVKGSFIAGVATVGVGLAGATAAQAGTVTTWNHHASTALLQTAGQPPQVATPNLAMVHGAVYDAVNAIDGAREGYLVPEGTAPPSASKDAAVVAAAHRVLVELVPAQAAALNDWRTASLASIPDGPAEDAGIATGEHAAATMLAARANDGRGGPYRFPVGTAPGVWRPVLPAFVNDPNAWLKDLEPFLIEDPAAFRSQGPLSLTSRSYAREFDEVKTLGSASSTQRTDDQTRAARYWSENPATTWSRTFRTLATEQGLSLEQEARLYAMLYTTGTDALIALWNDKAHWLSWRPITAIREAGSDGNSRTTSQADWVPLVGSPPYPEHPSGHSGYSGAFVKTLQHFFGTDDIGWSDTNQLNGIKRTFTSFSQAIREVVDARVWSGIHFRTADVDGHKIGRHVAAYRQGRFFGPAR